MKCGVPRHSIIAWMRRKHGSKITVWRRLASGDLGCTIPCVLCAKKLVQFDFQVVCPLDNQTIWSGKLTDVDAPVSKPTSRQAQTIFKKI
jgi:hypothetical protein